MEYKLLILISFFIGFTQCYNRKYCDDLSPYFGDINLDQITGDWSGVEIIPHVESDYKIDDTDDCFHINIRELNIKPNSSNGSISVSSEQHRVRHFVLEWHDEAQQNDYHIKINSSHRGFWPTEIPIESVDKMHRFFGGLIQVLKMTDKYLVLNFCIMLPYTQRFSVIVVRNETELTAEELVSIHAVFTMKNLSTSTLKRVCTCSALNLRLPNIFMLIIICASMVFNWRSKQINI